MDGSFLWFAIELSEWRTSAMTLGRRETQSTYFPIVLLTTHTALILFFHQWQFASLSHKASSRNERRHRSCYFWYQSSVGVSNAARHTSHLVNIYE